MSLIEQIDGDIKAAMLAKDSDRLSVLRMTKTALKNADIAAKGELDDEGQIKVVRKEIKQREESAQAFDDAGNPERAAAERSEAELLSTYVPAELDDTKLEEIVSKAISETGAESLQDMGKVMAEAMKQVAGQADGTRVSAIVKAKLS